MSALATIEELQARCDWTFDADEERAALGYLEEASDLARAYGRDTWTETTVPRTAKSIIISAVRRFMRNPDGYTQSRAGDETLAWADIGADAATIYFTNAETKLLRGMAGNVGLVSAQATAWGNHRRAGDCSTGSVPVSGWPGEKEFPYYADGEGRV